MKHTPGPWNIDFSEEDNVYFLLDRKNHEWIGTFRIYDDARISASAPEMLKELIGICMDWKYIDSIDPCVYIIPIIEKATGMTWEEIKKEKLWKT